MSDARLIEALTLGDLKVNVVDAQAAVVGAARIWVTGDEGMGSSTAIISAVLHLERMESDLRTYLETLREAREMVAIEDGDSQ